MTKECSTHLGDVTSPRLTRKFFLPLLLEDGLVTAAFHDSGAVTTCIGMEILDKILPSWKEYPEAETLPLKSHTNQSLKVVDAKVLPIKIPGTDINFLAPVQIEKGSQEMVIGRDIIISQKMGLKWEGDEKLFVTVPSAINPSHTWKIEVFRADLQLNTVRNVDEIHLEAGGEVAVRMHGTGGEN